MPLVVADTGIKGQTREAVKDIAQLAQNNPTAIAETMKQLGSFTKEAKRQFYKMINKIRSANDVSARSTPN